MNRKNAVRIVMMAGIAVIVLSVMFAPSRRVARAASVTRVQFQSAAAYTGSGKALSVTLPNPTTSGNELVVAVSDYYASDAPYTISDTYGNTWHLAVAYTANPYTAIFYAENITGGAGDQVTATAAKTGAFPIVTAVEYAGLATSGSLDVTASNNVAGTSYASPAITTTSAGDLLFAVHQTNGSASAVFTPTSPWATVQREGDGSNHEQQVQDQAVNAVGSYASNGTTPIFLTVESAIAAFKASSVSSDTTPPSVPANLTATSTSSSQINLSWGASTDNVLVTGYDVYRNGTQVGIATGTTYVDVGLAASTTYSYAIAAYDAAGNVSAQSSAASATTTPTPPDTTPPSVPVGLSATAISSSQINLAWGASTDNVGVAGYQIFRNGTQVATSSATGTSYADAGLATSTSYSYAVTAFDAAGNVSAQSNAATATTLATASAGTPIPTGTWTMVPTNGFPEAVVGYDNMVYAPGIKKFVMWDNYHNMTSESNQAYDVYDFASNRWDVAALGGDYNSENLPGSGHEVGMLQYDSTLNVFLNYCCFSGSQQYEGSQQMTEFDLAGLTGRNEQTLSRPGNTVEASAVFDVQDNVYVLFDRGTGTWIYSPATNAFTKMSPNGTPPNTVTDSAGYFSGMTYDGANDEIYLFGGSEGGGVYSNDLYSYSVPSNTWTKLSPSGTLPSARQYPGFAYDATDNIILMMGGVYGPAGMASYYNDTWVYDPTANSWTQLNPLQSPPANNSPFQRLAYDPDDNVFVLTWPGLGGYVGGQPSGYGDVQTWFFRYAGTGPNVGTANPSYTPTSGSLNRNANAWADEPQLASNGSTLYAGWIETGVPLASGNDIFPHPFADQLSSSTWTDLGSNYLALDSEFSASDEAHDPSMAVVNGTPWISWNKESNNGDLLPNDLYAKYWNAASSTWVGGPVGVVTSGPSDTAGYSQIIGVGGIPYIGFSETQRSCFPACGNLFVKTWDAASSTWNLVGTGTLDRNASSSTVSPDADSVAMATDGTHPYVAWTEFTMASTQQSDTQPQVYVDEWNGSTWLPLGGSLNNATSDWAYSPSIAYLNGQPYVSFTERSQTGVSQVFVKTWNGSAWTQVGSGTLNKNTSTGWAEHSSLVADANTNALYLGWVEQAALGQKAETYVDGYSGGAWTTLGGTLNADPVNGSAESVSLAMLDDEPVVAWGEVAYGSLRNVYTKEWNGSAWVAPFSLPNTTPPSVPANLAATAISQTQVNLAWATSTDPVLVTGYQVFRNGAQVATSTQTGYADMGLTAGTNYSYAVTAFDAAGNVSGQSSSTQATTLVPDTTPPVVTITSPAPSSTVSGLTTLVASATDNVAVASVQFQVDGVNVGSPLMATSGSVTYSYALDTTSLTNGTHVLTAVATDTSGNGATSAPISVTTNNVTPPVISGTQASVAGLASANVTWNTNVLANGEVAYGTSNSYGATSSLVTAMTTAHAITLSSLASSTTYHYEVISADANGNRGVSADGTFTTAGAITRIQFNSAAGYTGSSKAISVTLPNPTTSGNELIAAVGDYYASDGPYTLTDTYGNTWRLANAYTNGPYAAVFYAENITGGANDTITATAGKIGAFPIVTAAEYSGLVASGSLDVSAQNNVGGTSYASPAITTTQPDELLFALHHTNGSHTAVFTPASPWATVQLKSDGGNHEQQIQDQIVSATGTYTSTGSLPSLLTVSSVVVGFK